MKFAINLAVILLGVINIGLLPLCTGSLSPWLYSCDRFDRCVKMKVATDEIANDINSSPHHGDLMSHAQCKLTCGSGYALLWPRPRQTELGKTVTHFSLEGVEFSNEMDFGGSPTAQLLNKNIAEQVGWMRQKKVANRPAMPMGNLFSIKFNLDQPDFQGEPRIRKTTNESYSLTVSYSVDEKTLFVDITAPDYFGARHALETLFQLAEYDEVAAAYAIVDQAKIQDWPEFPHRGLTLDTSRSFIEPEVILRIIDGMGHDKLNVFHWHIVDTHSFPMELKADPVKKITEYGAYSNDMIYTQSMIRKIVKHANYRGVRVIPELDQPAHVGSGWNAPEFKDHVVCLNKEPWYKYCVEPPCGQLNPLHPGVYDALEAIYAEMDELFDVDSFHMGADEVHFGCWNSSSLITDYIEKNGKNRTKEEFITLWRDFQQRSSERLKKRWSQKEDLDIIVWTSDLTKEKYIDYGLPKEDYTIQIWTDGSDVKDPQIKVLADKGYRMIFSNYDALYMDCGYGAWVGEGNNWCTPYKGWQKVYLNDPYELLEKRYVKLSDEKKKQVLGGEVCMWSEQVDSSTVEGKLFPRASALGERLWSNPGQDWYDAEPRMLAQRTRLVQRGVQADALQPEWCRQNMGMCYAQADDPGRKEKKPRKIEE